MHSRCSHNLQFSLTAIVASNSCYAQEFGRYTEFVKSMQYTLTHKVAKYNCHYYASYYVLVNRDNMLITNTDKYILSTSC